MSSRSSLVETEGSQGQQIVWGTAQPGMWLGRKRPASFRYSYKYTSLTAFALRAVTVLVVLRTLTPVFEKLAQILLPGGLPVVGTPLGVSAVLMCLSRSKYALVTQVERDRTMGSLAMELTRRVEPP